MSEEPQDNGSDAEGPAEGAADGPDASAAAPQGAADDAATEPTPAEQPDATSEPSPEAPPADAASAAQALNLPELSSAVGGVNADGIDLLSDVNVNVRIELGRTEMLVEDVLRLGEGAVVELDKLAGDPVDIFVNDRPVARGEVLVLNDNFCVRVNEILSPAPKTGAKGAKQVEEPRTV